MTTVNIYYLTPVLNIKCINHPRMGSLHWQNNLFLTLNPSPFLKGKVRGYLSSLDVTVQTCPFSRLSSIIDWNGFASLTPSIAQSFNISHLFTQSLSLYITPATIISMHYSIYFISTKAVWFWSLIWRKTSFPLMTAVLVALYTHSDSQVRMRKR